MKRMLVRVLACLLVPAGIGLSALVFLIGAPAATGAPFREPVGTMCYDPWVETHPRDHEPDVSGSWSWWPPGVTCVHASGEVFLEPSASDAAAVGALGWAVLVLGVVPTCLAARALWRSAGSTDARR